MRLAVLADIHGNLPAIEAVVDDIGRRAVDQVVNLGDCASGPLWPHETLAGLMALGWPTVRGNHDRILSRDRPDQMSPPDRFAFDRTDSAERTWLTLLPPALDLGNGIVAFHASPGNDSAYLLEDIAGGQLVPAALDEVAERVARVDAAVILTGHSHRPGLIAIPNGPVVINPGSVGRPAYRNPEPPVHVFEVGAPHARYAILTFEDGLLAGVEQIALRYDHEAAAEQADRNGQPDWGYALRTGFMPV
ncbi:MAG: metallophosphoesterase family protein [Bauldia sp.]|nr:metallophosphoesterase family protein [Bauldia sp.]